MAEDDALEAVEARIKGLTEHAEQATTSAALSLESRLADLDLRQRRGRRLVKVLFISVIFDVLLSAGLGIVSYQAIHASHKASKASSATVVNCIAGNENAAKQHSLWNKVFTFPPPAKETPAQKADREAKTAEFKAFLDKTFVQHDCKRLR